jgi:hypothetical protein
MKKLLILMLFCSSLNAAPILGVHVTKTPSCTYKNFMAQVSMPRGTSVFLNDGPMYNKASLTHKSLGVTYIDYVISSPQLDPLYMAMYKNRVTPKGAVSYQVFLRTILKRFSNKLTLNNKCLTFIGNAAESTWTVSEPFGIPVYDEPTWLGLNEFLQVYPHKGIDGVPAKIYVVDSERNEPFGVIGCPPKLLPGKVTGTAKAKGYQQPYEKLPSEIQEHGNIMDNNVCSLTHETTKVFPVAVSEGADIADRDIEAGLTQVDAELNFPAHTDQSVVSLSEDKANGNRPEEDAMMTSIASKHNTLVFQAMGNNGFTDHGKKYNPSILRVGMCVDNPVLGAVTLASDSGVDGPDFCVHMSGLAQKVTDGGGVTSKPAYYGGSSTATSDSAAMGTLIKDQCPSVNRDDVYKAMAATATPLKKDFLENLPDQALNRVAHITNIANSQVKTGVVNFKKVMDELMKLPKCKPIINKKWYPVTLGTGWTGNTTTSDPILNALIGIIEAHMPNSADNGWYIINNGKTIVINSSFLYWSTKDPLSQVQPASYEIQWSATDPNLPKP